MKELMPRLLNVGQLDITFKRPRVACDLVGVFCPVAEECFVCVDFFNSYPWWRRAYYQIRHALKGYRK